MEAARDHFARAEAMSLLAAEQDPALLWPELNTGAALIEQAKLADGAPELIERGLASYARVLSRWPTPPVDRQQRAVYVAALGNTCEAQILLLRLVEARATCTEITELFPDDAVAVYNLAGAHALAGDFDAALAALRRDLELGDHDWEYLEHDAWFDGLRQDPRYLEIVREMKRRAS